MTENEKLLLAFKNIATLGDIVSQMLGVQAETNKLLADKLPNVSDEAKAVLRANALELEQKSQNFQVASKNLLDSVR